MALSQPQTSNKDYQNIISDMPFGVSLTQGIDFVLDEDIQLLGTAAQPARAFSCRVSDSSLSTEIVYQDLKGIQRSYFAHYSGIHPITSYGVVSIGSGLEAATFQVLI